MNSSKQTSPWPPHPNTPFGKLHFHLFTSFHALNSPRGPPSMVSSAKFHLHKHKLQNKYQVLWSRFSSKTVTHLHGCLIFLLFKSKALEQEWWASKPQPYFQLHCSTSSSIKVNQVYNLVTENDQNQNLFLLCTGSKSLLHIPNEKTLCR